MKEGEISVFASKITLNLIDMMESTSLVLGLSSIISPYKKKELPNTYVQVLFFLFVYTTARSLWWNGVLKPNGWEYDVGGDVSAG